MIAAAVHAPSGENCQPWSFRVQGNSLCIHNIPARDQSLYSWGQRASLVALGAAIENMTIAAAAAGYAVMPEFFPSPLDETWVATLRVAPAHTVPASFAPLISRRTTNRKPYKKSPLTQEERTRLLSAPEPASRAMVRLVEDRHAIRELARAGSTNERVLFTNRDLHAFFFGHINWTEQEDKEKSIGFYIKTLELPPPARLAFRVFRDWRRMAAANRIGAAAAVGAINAKIYSACAAVGGIIIPSDAKEDFLAAGRALQRVWLAATAEELYLQPMSGLAFLWLQARHGGRQAFSDRQRQQIETAYQTMRRLFASEDAIVAMMFRIGHAPPPSARASRLPPIVT